MRVPVLEACKHSLDGAARVAQVERYLAVGWTEAEVEVEGVGRIGGRVDGREMKARGDGGVGSRRQAGGAKAGLRQPAGISHEASCASAH